MLSILIQYLKNFARRGPARRYPFDILTSILAKPQKIEGGNFGGTLGRKKIGTFWAEEKFRKVSIPKNRKGTLQHPFCCKKMKGEPWGDSKKVTMPKKLKGDPLLSPGIVCYAKKKKLFGSLR